MSDGPIRCVALDAMGVITASSGVASSLAAFCTDHGASTTLDRARELYVAASAGEMDAAGLWRALGVPGAAAGLDAAFVAGSRTPMTGLGPFLEAMAGVGVSVGCITNDVAAWSAILRRSFGLEGTVDPWVVSAEVGVRKPGRAIFEAFLARACTAPEACLFVDDIAHNLDGAAAMGFSTACFMTPANPGRDPGAHPVVTSFSQVQDLVAGRAPVQVS